MNIYDNFCKVLPPRNITLVAIGGCVAGRFYKISSMHGAVYAVTAHLVYRVAVVIHRTIFTGIPTKRRIKMNFGAFMSMPFLMTTICLSYAAGNKALSLVGRQLAFETAVKVSCVSGVISFFSGLLVDYMRE